MPKKIFIAEDDQAIARAMIEILEDEGHSVSYTSDGTSAVKKIKTFAPDLIFLDLLMSGTDGRVICRDLKGNRKTRQARVIMVSAHPSAREWAKESGADGYLPKPFNIDELVKIANS